MTEVIFDNCINYTYLKDIRKDIIDTIIILKKKKKFYIGATNNPEERIKRHHDEKI